MACYLLDASALVPFLQQNPAPDMASAKNRLKKLLALRSGRKGPPIFIPNFCLAECSKALANLFLSPRYTERGERSYRQHVETMLDWVSSSRQGIIRPYKLRREHLVGVEEVFEADYRLSDRDEKRLSGVDGLVIAMGRALERSQGKDRAVIVTNDRRLAAVCAANRDRFPRAVYLKEQEIPGT